MSQSPTLDIVPVYPISLTSFRSRGQEKFKYSYLPLPSEALFKDKTSLFLTMAVRRACGDPYSYLLPPSESPFMDKTVTLYIRIKIHNIIVLKF